MSAYSFLDVDAVLVGAPFGHIDLGSGNANSEEGLEWSYDKPRTSKVIGADSNGMIVVNADRSGTIRVRLLETSPANAKLTAAMNAVGFSTSLHGQAVLTIRNRANETMVVASEVSFADVPGDVFGAEPGVKEWVFNAIRIEVMRGEYR